MKVKSQELLSKKSANEVWIVEMDDGSRWIWKPVSGASENLALHRVNWIRREDGHRREAGVYQIAQFLGLDGLVPETRVARIKGQTGSLQRMVDGDTEKELRKAKTEYGSSKAHKAFHADKLAFDYFIGMHDRHLGNFMVELTTGEQPRFAAGHLIDNAESGGMAPWRKTGSARSRAYIGANRHKTFRKKDGSMLLDKEGNVMKIGKFVRGLPRNYTKRMILGLLHFNEQAFLGEMAKYFTEPELLAMCERRFVILRHYHFLSKDVAAKKLIVQRARDLGWA